jgi:hypothetical protein
MEELCNCGVRWGRVLCGVSGGGDGRVGRWVSWGGWPWQAVDSFGCKSVDGVVSHQIKRFSTDGTKVVMNKAVPGHQVPPDRPPRGAAQAHGRAVS